MSQALKARRGRDINLTISIQDPELDKKQGDELPLGAQGAEAENESREDDQKDLLREEDPVAADIQDKIDSVNSKKDIQAHGSESDESADEAAMTGTPMQKAGKRMASFFSKKGK